MSKDNIDNYGKSVRAIEGYRYMFNREQIEALDGGRYAEFLISICKTFLSLGRASGSSIQRKIKKESEKAYSRLYVGQRWRHRSPMAGEGVLSIAAIEEGCVVTTRHGYSGEMAYMEGVEKVVYNDVLFKEYAPISTTETKGSKS